MRIGTGSAIVLGLALWPGVASAQNIPSNGLTINEVVSWLQGKGLPAQIGAAQDNSNNVESRFGNTKFNVMMFDCNGDRCGSIQFWTGFANRGSFDISKVNEWNRDKRWARAYYGKDNSPYLEMDVDVAPGGTYDLLNDELETWKGTLTKFMTTYGAQ